MDLVCPTDSYIFSVSTDMYDCISQLCVGGGLGGYWCIVLGFHVVVIYVSRLFSFRR